ncbi:hypothetical protein [Streptomyces capillispiralis]|uniref:hypothetical protein n=1 Tax=Streptomyces capillispiralis TaxID=68182 RepID=UPI00119D6529|nr:hypothetical protein [Streptomyces capillispiralis]
MAFAATAAAATTLFIAPPAGAAEHYSGDTWGNTGRCGWATCLFYNSYQQGSGAGFDVGAYNFEGLTWPDGNAKGQPIKNNAASGEADGQFMSLIYYNSNQMGNLDWFNPHTYGQLYYTYNENASCSC